MTITLNDVDRGAVVRREKRAHLFPVPRSGEQPFRVGQRHELARTFPDPYERYKDGEKKGQLVDAEPPPECHVVITKVTEVLLDELVKAEIRAMNYERITDVKRWWLDQRRPTWRKPYEAEAAEASTVRFYGRVLARPCGEGAFIGAQTVQDEYARRLGTTTAFLVRWEVDQLMRSGYLAPVTGPRTRHTSPQMRSAGQALPPDFVKLYVDRGHIADDNRRRKVAGEKADKAVALLEQVDALFKGEDVPAAEKRRHRSRHRRTMHFLEQDVRGFVERAKA